MARGDREKLLLHADERGADRHDLLLYDSRYLTTYAVAVERRLDAAAVQRFQHRTALTPSLKD